MANEDGIRENPNNLEEKNVLEFSVHHYVLVSLTEDGKNILKKYFLDLFKDGEFYERYGYSSVEEYVEKEQLPMYYKDGYCKIQLRELMSVFGEFIGRRDIFKDNKIYFIESNDDYALGAKKVSSKMNERLLDVLS